MVDHPDDPVMQDPANPQAKSQPTELPVCDVIMKGGITSGIVYPLAILELSKKYRLQNIGGTSAGAVAAAVAAAAEYGRHHRTDDYNGYNEVLAKIPNEMSKNLLSLFQPSPDMRPLFEMLIAAQKGKSKPGKLGRALWAGMKNYPLATGAGVLAGLIAPHLVLMAGMKLGTGMKVLLPLLGGGGGLSAQLLSAINKKLPAHDFGMCTGLTQPGYGKPALTNWLADMINLAAGKKITEPPLTFGDLIGPEEKTPRINLQMMTTNLSMRRPYRLPLETDIYSFRKRDFAKLFPRRVMDHLMNTAVPYPGYDLELLAGKSTRKPETPTVFIEDRKSRKFRFRIFEDRGRSVVFKTEEELQNSGINKEHWNRWTDLKQQLLDDDWWGKRKTLNSLEKYDIVQTVMSLLGHTPRDDSQLEDYYYFPNKTHLPVVVAARMSLSFPGLISAVPLYACDYTLKGPEDPKDNDTDKDERKKPRKCLFSDGGLSSNFPIHLFDQLLPNSPTFGITLEPHDKRRHGNTFVKMPVKATQGKLLPIYPIEGPGSFAMTVLNTAKDWQDNLQSILPGYSERIVHLALTEKEGGLNLTMPPETIKRLSDRGEEAGLVACGKSTTQQPPAGKEGKFDLNDHRWRRFLIAMANLEEAVEELGDAYQAKGDGNVEPFDELLKSYVEPGDRVKPLSYSKNSIPWLKERQERIKELLALKETWRDREGKGEGEGGKKARVRASDGDIPKPATELRLVPRDT